MFCLCVKTLPQGFEGSDLSILGLLSLEQDPSALALLIFGAEHFFVVGTALCMEDVYQYPGPHLLDIIAILQLKRSLDVAKCPWGVRGQSHHQWRITALDEAPLMSSLNLDILLCEMKPTPMTGMEWKVTCEVA